MKINIALGISAIFLSFSIHAQNAKVTLANGTIVEGDMQEFSNMSRTPDQIKVLVGGKLETYDPSQITGFEINGDRYISRVVDLNINDQDAQNLRDFSELEWVLKRVFLRVLIDGTVSLYTYRDTRLHYFAIKEKTNVELVKLNRLNKSTVNQYVGQLSILFSDCNKSMNTSEIQFNTISLKRAVIDYNECVSGGSDYIEKREPADISFYVLGGLNLTSFTVSGDGPFAGYQADPKSASSFTYGVAFDIQMIRKSRKMVFYNEILLQNYVFGGYTRNQVNSQQYIDYYFDVDLKYLEMTNALRFNFGNETSDANFFGNFGVNHGFLVSSKGSEYSNNVFYGTETLAERELLGDDISTYRISFSLGIGVRYKIALAEMRYGFKPKVSNNPITTQTSPLNFLLALKVF